MHADLDKRELEALIERYAEATQRNAIEMCTMPAHVVRQHFREFAADVLALHHHTTPDGWRPTHRHVKRGSEYQLLGMGKMQTERWVEPGIYPNPGLADMREVAIYRSVDDGSLWARPREEFEDGRFDALAQKEDRQ